MSISTKTDNNSNFKTNILIAGILCALTAVAVVFGILNYNQMQIRLERIDGATFVIIAHGQEHVVTVDVLNEMGLQSFTANRRSSGMPVPVEAHFAGVPLADLCTFLGIDISDAAGIVAAAADGFHVGIGIDRVLDNTNVWIAAMEDGVPLASREEGGIGPFMLVVRHDTFSQNWCRYLIEITFR